MRKLGMILGVVAALSGGLVWAAVDLSDFDDDVMRAMDDAFKDLEPVIGAKNAETALSDAAILLEGNKWTEDYFVQKGNTADAVKWAQEGQELVKQVIAALEKKDFDAASVAARATAKNCRACHDVYKPLTK